MTGRPTPIVDRVTDAFFALDTDFRFTYLNDRAETLFEHSRSELLGRVMWDEFPETVETQFPDGFYRAMDEQVPVSFEVYHTHLETWFEARAYPSASGLSVFMRDVTDRKTQERRLAQHAAVVEAIHDGVVVLDRRTEIVAVNDSMERILGADRRDLLGEHVEIVPELASIEAEEAIDIGRAIADVDIGNAVYRRVTVSYTDAAGDDRVGELQVVPVEDETATVAAILRDLTERYEYERVVTSMHELTRWLLQSDDPQEICAIAVHAGSELLDLPISGIWLLEDEHGYLEPVAGTAGAHDEFGGLPRFNPGEGLIWEVFESGDVERYDDLHDESLEGVYNPDTPIRSEIIAPIGTHGVLMTGSVEAERFDETDVELVSTLVENTTAALDRAEQERVLRERTSQLERQTERLEAVAEVLSNDLKDQLDAVADALEDDGAADEWEFPLAEDAVETTLDRTERLVDDIREFARNATAVGPRARIDLESALEEAIEASTLERDRVSLVVEEPATLRADPDRFAHLLETLFDDVGARADEDAPVTVQVGLLGFDGPLRSRGARGFYLLDDAATIHPGAEGDADREPDRDADGSRSDPVADGLGLALVRAIAEAHDWSVDVAVGDRGGTKTELKDVTTLEPEP
ncbi:PAS domain-containing protein [Natrialbaceae archaeon GCM10025810]|uniref:PAS domain-containing sensor histidine kinase n=1 Tax=Halovalidus salilacus TaxID=3075124 RepID=UPI00360F01E6